MSDQLSARTTDEEIVQYHIDQTRIFGSLRARNLGDFVGQNIVAASVKNLFDLASLVVEANVSADIHRRILEYNTHIDHRIDVPAGQHIPMSVFDVYAGAPVLKAEGWDDSKCRFSNIFLAGSNLSTKIIPALPFKARLTYPDARVDQSSQFLTEKGLDPDRWFAVIHWRESGYPGRPDEALRDVKDVSSYIDTIRHIIGEQNGQVVRIGHQGSSSLPDGLAGVVDLTAVPESFDLQCFAISRARYFVGSCSGPNVLGPAFGTPSLITNQLGPDAVWNRGDICLTQTLRTGDGRLLTGDALFRTGLLDHNRLKSELQKPGNGMSLRQNTAREIIHCADLMYRRTADCTGWRVPDPIGALPDKRQNYLPQPIQPSFNTQLFSDNQ